MKKEAIYHVSELPYAFGVGSDQLNIRIRTKKNDIAECYLLYADRFDWPMGKEDLVMMSKVASDLLFDYFETVINVAEKRFRYKFFLKDREGISTWYGEDGFVSGKNGTITGYFQFPYLCEQDIVKIPEWAKESIVYEIFPQSFHNGDTSNDPPKVTKWGELPKNDTFYGGDLKGIIDKLNYIQDLGVNTLYLTPIFKAQSPHKYDTIDYLEIDPSFGDLETFKTLVKECHNKNIRVILDAVFTFTGYNFFAFQDVVKNEKESKYLDWFNIYNFPVEKNPTNFETFAKNVWMLPKVYRNSPEAREYFLKVSKFWIEETGIDGWRLDTCNEVEHDFWRDFRKAVKEVNPEAIIIGEIWHDAESWLRGDQLDSVMNYCLKEAVIRFFAKKTIDAEIFDNLIARVRMLYPDQVTYVMLNLLDSHDTARFLTECEEDKDRMRLAVIFQLTYIGIPMIYYGDEIGMSGKNDPDCRRTMIWDEENQDKDMLDLYKKLIKIRKKYKAITKGEFQTYVMDPLKNIYGYLRMHEGEKVAILINNSLKEQNVELDLDWLPKGASRLKDLLNNKNYKVEDKELSIKLKPYGAVILTV